MHMEYEEKFQADPFVLEEIDRQVAGVRTVYTMQTTYYDTPTKALSARGYTLRRRLENDTAVCTLKIPGPEGGRAEYQVEAQTIEDAIPMVCKLCPALPLALLFAEGVTPLCGAAFTRIAKEVTLDSCVVEVALDLGVLTGGGHQTPLCEVEVELVSGSREAAVRYAQQLAQTYGLTIQPRSKFSRAKALAET